MIDRDRAERLIEVYVGIGDGDGGTWFVVDIYVPADIEEETAKQVALAKVMDDLDSRLGDSVAFCGIYSYWDDEQMEEFCADWDDDNDDDDWDDDDDYDDDVDADYEGEKQR